MIAYYLPLLFLSFFSFIKIKKQFVLKLLVIFIGIFLCTTYFNGSDWRQYELMYQNVNLEQLNNFHKERGFYFYILFFKFLNFNFWNFFIFTKLLIYYIFYMKIVDFSKRDFPLIMLVLFSAIGIFLFIDCPFRNLIAIGIFLYGEKYLRNGKYLKYIFFVIISFCFHQTAIFFILLPFLKNIYKTNKWILIMIIILSFLILSNQKLVMMFISHLPLFKERLIGYMNGIYFENRLFSLGNLEKISVILIIIYNKNKIIRNNYYNRYYISYAIIYIILYRIAITIPILGRLALYLQLYYIFMFKIIYDLFNFKKIFLGVVFIYFSLITYKQIYNSYKYIPYSSYITYIFKEKPSYDYRSKYNYIKWEERFNKKYIRR